MSLVTFALKPTYAADAFGDLIVRYSYDEEKIYLASIEGVSQLGFIVPVEGGSNEFVIGVQTTAIVVTWDGRSTNATKTRDLFSIPDGINLNSATVSPSGDIYMGSLGQQFCNSPPDFSLYHYSACRGVESVANNFVVSVGSAIDRKKGILYNLDACEHSIKQYDLDYKTGNLSNERLLMTLDLPKDTAPHGLAMDTNGHFFSGLYNGSAVIEIDPKKKAIVNIIELPTPFITVPAFGGPKLDVLFVATSNLPVVIETGVVGSPIRVPPAGNLFMIRGLQANGTPSYQARIKNGP